MTRRIFRSILLVASAVLLACFAVIMGVLYEYFTTFQKNQLSSQMALAAAGVEKGGAEYLKSLRDEQSRITWVSADGKVLFDSEANAGAMENHAGRQEISEALKTGSGESSRYSSTLAEKTLYLAKRLSDGTVLRISVTQYTVVALVMGMLQPVLAVFAAAVILSSVLAGRLSKRIVEPLNTLNLDSPLENDAYEELAPLLSRIEQQHRQINSQVAELRHRQSELSAVTSNMNEGLVLLNEEGIILSINPAACRIFGVGSDSVNRDFLTVDRSRDIAEAIGEAAAAGHSERNIDRAGREYQLDVSRIGSAEQSSGVVLFVFDVTEKVFAERNRREFTANVSHELKTPLQSIMGSAELIENGLVKAADLPHFVGRIRSEASRLVTLIDDIIRLSQLDEGSELPLEAVDLHALAEETAESLKPAAEAGRVSISVAGGPAVVNSVRRLAQEIIFNLCDNAVKYNVEGGRVAVSVSKEENGALLTVADTGIGIPPEHQSRIFERFYRVDKSRSKDTGGTGLGLSIVKHAALRLGAEVRLESEPGRGTTVTVRFKN